MNVSSDREVVRDGTLLRSFNEAYDNIRIRVSPFASTENEKSDSDRYVLYFLFRI